MAEYNRLIPVDSVEDEPPQRCVRCSEIIYHNPTGNLFCRECIQDIWEHAQSYGEKQTSLRVIARRNHFLRKARATKRPA
jgi:hypothetical protein